MVVADWILGCIPTYGKLRWMLAAVLSHDLGAPASYELLGRVINLLVLAWVGRQVLKLTAGKVSLRWRKRR